MYELVLLTILLALLFDFINGFHDSANAIATVVATRVLTPLQAVTIAGIANFVGPFVFGVSVAKTIQGDILRLSKIEDVALPVILSGLVGAIVWDLLTWWWGLPTSSSHALVGGLIGSGLAAGGAAALKLPSHGDLLTYLMVAAKGVLAGLVVALLILLVAREARRGLTLFLGGAMGFSLATAWVVYTGSVNLGGIGKTVAFIMVSPFLGFASAYLVTVFLMWALQSFKPVSINRVFGRLQIFSSAFYSLTHGSNDAQKTMGVITGAALVGNLAIPGPVDNGVPVVVILTAATAIGLGTLFGGWRIVKTMATRITHLDPYQGFAAETSGGAVLAFMARHGIPVSTTHAISGSIMGVGATKKLSAVRWGVARRIMVAWLVTIPASAVVAAVTFYIVQFGLHFTG